MEPRTLKDAVAVKELAEKLAKCTAVSKYDDGSDKEAWTLAHAFADLEQSFCKYLDTLLPKLATNDMTAAEMREVLLEIGEEFRHILYHINDPKFYQYLNDDS